MKTVCLTPSANWYSAGALASDGERLLVGCARQALLLVGPAPAVGAAGAAPSLQCHGVIEDSHRERVTGAVVWRSPAGAVLVVSCGEDGVVKLWKCDFEESKFQYCCEKQHNAHGKQKVAAVAHAACSPHVAISVDERGTFVVWDTVAHTTRTLFLERMAPTELRCSPHTEHVVAVAGKRGLLWTVSLAASGRVLQKLRGHDDDVTSISWCPELTTLLSFEQDHLLVSASKDKTLRVWGTRGGRCHVTQRVPALESGGRRQGGGGGAERAWLAVLWTQADCLYSSGLAGQLLRWRLSGDADNCQVAHRSHGRSVFNIVRLGELVVSSGIQRQLVAHDPRSLLTGVVPCLGGQAAALDVCPVDPGRLAIGCGDQTIRVWNLGADTPYSTVSIWQGIKAKVLTVAWHPQKDTRFAFGTDEGRVGVCDPSSARAPQLCPEHHSGPVYSVSWSPSGQLFSLSLGAVWRHDSARLTAACWPPAAGRAPCTQLSWGGGGAALGRQDGAVELLAVDGALRGAALGHRRLVTALKWCPQKAGDGTTSLAVASYDTIVSVFDVPDLGGSACPQLLQARVTLTGHKSRVLDLAWLPDTSSTQLVSASQDATVRVWDTVSGSVLAVYAGHQRPVRCCLPHPLLPGLVFSGGDDCSLHLWRIDEQDSTVPENVSSEVAATQSSRPAGKEKRRPRAGPAGVAAAVMNGADGGEVSTLAAVAAQPRELGDGRKTRTQRSLFPLTGAAENRGKAHSQADLEHLMAAGDASASGGDNWKHLGLFGDDAALREMIGIEMSHHESQKSAAQLLHMSLWRGDAAAVVRAAAAEAVLTDELLALAPMVSYRFWEEMSVKFAQQLENSKDCLKASSVLLACHRVTEAVSLLVRHGLYREALCVSRLRLSSADPSHGSILRLWADQLVTDGNMEQAAKCYLSLGDRAAAAGVLSRRSDPGSLRLAARLWAEAGDPTQARALALLCLHSSCIRADWDVGLAVAREVPAVAAGQHLCIAHRVLTTELERIREQLFSWAAGLLRGNLPTAAAVAAATARATGQERRGEKSPKGPQEMGAKSPAGEETGTECLEGQKELQETESAGEEKRETRTEAAAAQQEQTASTSEHEEQRSETIMGQQEQRSESTTGHQERGAENTTGHQERGAENTTGHQERGAENTTGHQERGTENTAVHQRQEVEGRDADGLLTQIRQAWRTAGAETAPGLQSGLQEVAYRTMPTSPKQLWLGVCSELCLAALESDPAASAAHLVKILALCQQSVPAQLPLLCALLVPAATGVVWETGRQCILPAVLSVVHQRALLSGDPRSTAANGAEVAPSTAAGEQSQCAAPTLDGSSGIGSGRKASVSSAEGSVTSGGLEGGSVSAKSVVSPKSVLSAGGAVSAISGEGDASVVSATSADADLGECVRRLSSLYVTEKTREEERMFSELEQRLNEL